jgi:hypothetical protein
LPQKNVTEGKGKKFEATGGAAPRDLFLNTLQRHPNLGVVVLLCGFPSLDSQGYEALKQSGATIVVASGHDRQSTDTLQDWFKQEFLLITPTSTATLPY